MMAIEFTFTNWLTGAIVTYLYLEIYALRTGRDPFDKDKIRTIGEFIFWNISFILTASVWFAIVPIWGLYNLKLYLFNTFIKPKIKRKKK